MKREYILKKDTTFTHVKDRMYHGSTEHILQDDATKKFYHYVVSYGSWFHISDESVFMSYLLDKIGVSGLSKSMLADGCKIVLPYYPSVKPTKQAVVQMPDDVRVEDVSFDKVDLPVSDEFKETFIGKYVAEKSQYVFDSPGEEFLQRILGCMTFRLCEVSLHDEKLPIYTIISKDSFKDYEKRYFSKKLQSVFYGQCDDFKKICYSFARLDIQKELESFEKSTGVQYPSLFESLIYRQREIQRYCSIQLKETQSSETSCLEM